MGVIHAYNEASQTYVGSDAPTWNTESFVFLWLLFHIEMLILGPKPTASKESIS